MSDDSVLFPATTIVQPNGAPSEEEIRAEVTAFIKEHFSESEGVYAHPVCTFSRETFWAPLYKRVYNQSLAPVLQDEHGRPLGEPTEQKPYFSYLISVVYKVMEE